MNRSRIAGIAIITMLTLSAAQAETANRAIERPQEQITNELEDARRLLSGVDNCSLGGIPALQELLRKYEQRPEPELRLIAAEARYLAGNTLRFRSHEKEAQRWLESVVRRYGHEPDIQFRRVVARSNYMLGTIGSANTRKEKYLQRVLSAFRETDDLQLLQTYAQSLFALSDIRRASRRATEADALAKQAAGLYRDRIIPRLPPPDLNEPICV